MTETLFDAALGLARILGGVTSGVATGGSTSTIVDTALTEPNDHYNFGAAFITYDAGGASAAPEGEFSRISDFTLSTNTVAVKNNFTAAVASGDHYSLTQGRYGLDMLIDKINIILGGLLITAEDTTSLDTASAQTEYTLPAACYGSNLRQVWWEWNEDSNDNKWQEIRDWYVKYGATGSQDTLVIPQLTASRDLRLTYVIAHPLLYNATDKINEAVHIDRVIWEAASLVMVEEMMRNTGNKQVSIMANYYESKAQEMRQMHPVKVPPLNGRIFIPGIETDSSYTGEVGSVHI